MRVTIVKEAENIWKKIAKGTGSEQGFELSIQKKLLEFFQVGDYYYYIFNVRTAQFDFVSPEITKVLGYEQHEIDVPFLLSLIHEEDQPWFLNFENKVVEFFSTLSSSQMPNYKVRYDYRIRKKNGEYIRILQQVVTIEYSEEKGVLKTFGVHTDISHIKHEGTPVLSFIGLNGEPSYIGVQAPELFVTNDLKLTAREKQILRMLVNGAKTEEISKALFISKMTVQSHRKNIMRKTNSTSIGHLVSNAVKQGWV